MSKIEYNTALKDHRKKMNSLKEQHKNEIDRVRNSHQKQKNELKTVQDQELVTRRSEGEKQVLSQTHRHEKTLEKLRESLEQTEKAALKRQNEKLENLDKNLENHRVRNNENIVTAKIKHDMAMDELHQKAELELNRLQREINSKKAELKYANGVEISQAESRGEKKLSMTKKSYLNKKNADEDKYQRALTNQKDKYDTLITNEERKFQKEITGKTQNFQAEISKIKADGQQKNQKTQALFEKKFQELQKSNEKLLTKLIAKKSEIIQKLRNEVLETHKLDAQKVGDPFYAVTGLDPIVEKNQDHYLIHLEVDKENAGAVEFNGHKRKLTLSLNRRFENTTQDDGNVEKLKRIETLTRNFSVDNIIDENKVEKSYNDGVLTFKVMMA